MSDSEARVLAAILPDRTARMEKAQLNLVSEANFDHPHLKHLWKMLDAYYDDHLAVIPEWALKEKLAQQGTTDSLQIALVEVYRHLAQMEVLEHEFNEAINLMKHEELTRKTEEILVSGREILHGEYYDTREDRVLRGQEKAREFLSEQLRGLESLGAEYAPEGDVKDDLEKIWQEYLQKEANPDDVGGIKYGIEELDDFTGGIRPGELVLLAGFTGSGKSHMATSLTWNAMLSGKNVLMFTTETTREEMEIRVLARHSRLPYFKTPAGLDSHDIMNGTLSPEHREKFREVLDDFRSRDTGHLWMVQMPANGVVDYVHAKANQYNRLAPVDLIVIDSINLLRMGRRYDSKREMLEDLLQEFKRFASSFDGGRGVAVVSPWQMSRSAWREALEAGGTYSLASLSDTSEAEKSASQIISIFKDDDPSGGNGRINLQGLKNRSGKEMPKVSFPYDYRNSFIGSSGDAGVGSSKPSTSASATTRDILSFMGG